MTDEQKCFRPGLRFALDQIDEWDHPGIPLEFSTKAVYRFMAQLLRQVDLPTSGNLDASGRELLTKRDAGTARLLLASQTSCPLATFRLRQKKAKNRARKYSKLGRVQASGAVLGRQIGHPPRYWAT
jgi:hypothetical protein